MRLGLDTGFMSFCNSELEDNRYYYHGHGKKERSFCNSDLDDDRYHYHGHGKMGKEGN
jgi:hypothetical protein